MTEEPTYHYIKGEGWVTGPTCESVVVTTKCGQTVRVELRAPLPGEHYWDHGSIRGLTSWAAMVECMTYDTFCLGESEGFDYGESITIIKL